MFVLDSHCDTPSELLRGRDLFKDNPSGHIDLPKLKRGMIDGAFFALYIPASMDAEPSSALKYSETLLAEVEKILCAHGDVMRLATTPDEGHSNKDSGLFSIFLGLENASPIGNDIGKVKYFYNKGIRYITLCHSSDNQICDSCASEIKTWHGLSPFGKEVVAEMNSIGMLIDVSHISDEAFYDVLELSSKPVVATHSCCRSLADHPRNMTDDMIRKLSEAGGVVQVNFYPVFLDNSYATAMPSYKRIADHIDHIVDIAGIDHVGIGSDFDGIEITPTGLEDISKMPKIFEELGNRGYSTADLEKIASGNFFRVMTA